MNTDECTICCSPYNARENRMHQCANCNHCACFSCHKTFLLGSSNDARCMNCNAEWSTVYLFRTFPSAFVTEYRKSRRESIWNRELYHLPTIVEYVDLRNRMEHARTELTTVSTEIFNLKAQYQQLKGRRDKEAVSLRASIKAEKTQKEDQENLKNRETLDFRRRMLRIENRFYRPGAPDIWGDVGHRLSPVAVNSSYRNRPCIKENCRGFVNTDGHCPICSTTVCIDCNVEIVDGQDHTCQQADIDNWREIRDNSRPCPSCHVFIFKISGCNQMYCTNCATAFNWVTGMIETGPVHNPHYYEEMFANPRRVRNLNVERPGGNCENRPILSAVDLRIRMERMELTQDQRSAIFERHRQLLHVKYDVLPKIGSITDQRYRVYIFNALLDHVVGKDVTVKVERFLNRKTLNNEYVTLLETYINQQKQLFRAFRNDELSVVDLLSHHDSFREIMQDTLKDYNKMFKKTLKITL